MKNTMFKKGDLLEVGVADYPEDESGFSVYLHIDVENVETDEIYSLFNRNVLYIKYCDSDYDKKLAQETSFSQLRAKSNSILN